MTEHSRQSVWETQERKENESHNRLSFGVYIGKGSKILVPSRIQGRVQSKVSVR